jgi:hypothetical protein
MDSTLLPYVAWRAGTTIGLVPARQAENRFLGSLKGLQIRTQATQPGGIGSLDSILGLLKNLIIRALYRPCHLGVSFFWGSCQRVEYWNST